MPYRARFDCLWCGTAWAARGPDDLEGWAQLCPDCLGRAGSNAFLRGRVRTAIERRAASGASAPAITPGPRPGPPRAADGAEGTGALVRAAEAAYSEAVAGLRARAEGLATERVV